MNVKKEKNQKGITLITLVVTVVLLLILSGITISTILNSDGVIKRAQELADITTKKQIISDIQLDLLSTQLAEDGENYKHLTQSTLNKVLSNYEKEGLIIIHKTTNTSGDIIIEYITIPKIQNEKVELSELYQGTIK